MSIIDDALKKTQADLEKKEKKDFSIIYGRLRRHHNLQEKIGSGHMTAIQATKKKSWYKGISVLLCISFTIAVPIFVVLSRILMKRDSTAQISVPIQPDLSDQHSISAKNNIIMTEFSQYEVVTEGGVRGVEQYARGYNYDEKGNYKEAAKWYREAAEQGHVQAQTNLGILYSKGRWVEQDYKEAVRWYRKAAEQGYARAQTNLGFMYEEGLGVKQDYKEAIRWYRKAAEQKYTHAQFNLGLMYSKGHGVEQDYKEAVRWYREAAEKGHTQAQNSLGLKYEEGLGVKQDYKEAIGWYRKAAENGYALAQTNLGIMYEEGLGAERNYKEAIWWYQKAAEQGIDYAKEALKRLE